MTREARRTGFAAVDALIALTLLALTLAFCLQAAAAAARASRTAVETRQIEALSRYALTGTTQTSRVGTSRDIDWRVDIAAEPAIGPSVPALCRKVFTAVNRRTGRRYDLQTVSACARGTRPP